MEINSPCFRIGRDCEKRKVGCRSACEEWATYREKVDALHKKKEAEWARKQVAIDYLKESKARVEKRR